VTLRGTLRTHTLLATLGVACSDGPTGPNVGRLVITVSGLPVGAAAAVTVEGPDGFSETVTAGTTLDALPAGQYIVAALGTTFASDSFASTFGEDTLRVSRGRSAEAAIAYALATGSITFSVAGVPAGAAPEALMFGPGGRSRTVQLPGEARGLVPGSWRVSYPRALADDGHGYAAPSPDTILVAASATPVARNLSYALATGSLNVTFNGLPDSVAPLAYLFATFGIVGSLTADGETRGLTPDAYTIAPQNVFDEDIRYSATSVSRSVAVGLVPQEFVVNYIARTGRLTLSASGLPPGAVASARVSGPANFDSTIVLGDTLRGLTTGSYTVEGALIEFGGDIYTSADLGLVSVVGAQTTVAALTYSAGGTFDVRADAAYAVQTVQRYDGSVPLVAGRDALIRVFADASAPNAFSAPARVRILQGLATVFEQTIPATWSGIPTSNDESTFAGSWRVAVPGVHLQPGAQLQVTIDPDETLPDSDRSNNTLTRALDLRALPTFRARFVPIRFSAGGSAGNVSVSNTNTFLQLTRDMMPVADVDVDVRAEYVTNQPRLTTSNGAVWETVLGELNAVRVIESSQRYYMGIIPVGYSSGIAGIGYLGTPTSLTWDYLPSGSEVLAHELGHNFNRYHAPCGNPGGPDPLYPHFGGDIGAYGWDARLNRLRAPNEKDIMSYCEDPWVSDYTWEGVVDFREANEPLSVAGALSEGGVQQRASQEIAPRQSVMLVRGRITPNGVEIEPTFTLDAVPELPKSGPHRLELRDASGAVIYSAAFAGTAVPHAEIAGTEHFTFAIPLSALGGRSAAALVVSAAVGGRSELRARSDAALRVAPTLSAVRNSDGGVRITHSDAATSGMIIRDAASGRVISIVRGREASLPAGLGELEVLASDGLRSSTLRIRPPTR